jgi:hypothetical protein
MILFWGEEHYLVSSPNFIFNLRIRIRTFLLGNAGSGSVHIKNGFATLTGYAPKNKVLRWHGINIEVWAL